MKSNIWFYLCIIQGIAIILGVIFLTVPSSTTVPEPKSTDLKAYLSKFHEDNNFIPEAGYIPDAETAMIVGSAIIDRLAGTEIGGLTSVEYDAENRLWLVDKGYLLNPGGFVVIEQDTGRVIKALLEKN